MVIITVLVELPKLELVEARESWYPLSPFKGNFLGVAFKVPGTIVNSTVATFSRDSRMSNLVNFLSQSPGALI